jgi:hypothetical protein
MKKRGNRKGEKGKISICCVGWIMVLLVLVIFYSYKFYQFHYRVIVFENKIKIGMHAAEVLYLLGPPSRSFSEWKIQDSITQKIDPIKKYDKWVYKGFFFLQDDLILYFESDTGRLVYKDRFIVMPIER